MRVFVYSCLAMLVCGAAFSQSNEAPPAFEAADIHVSAHSANPNLRGPFLRDGVYQVRMAAMVDLVSAAYGVDAEKVAGGPSWLEWTGST